jgi:ABC-type uncharacterized transport system auxiliary subunit
MTRKFIAIVLVTLSLGGCASVQAVFQGISLATKTVTNPVTREEEAKIELAMDTALQLLLTYRRACIAGNADVNCKANIRTLQPYTRAAVPLLAQLRSFVDNNDQINASVVYNQLTSLYVNLKAAAQSVGVNVGS